MFPRAWAATAVFVALIAPTLISVAVWTSALVGHVTGSGKRAAPNRPAPLPKAARRSRNWLVAVTALLQRLSVAATAASPFGLRPMLPDASRSSITSSLRVDAERLTGRLCPAGSCAVG